MALIDLIEYVNPYWEVYLPYRLSVGIVSEPGYFRANIYRGYEADLVTREPDLLQEVTGGRLSETCERVSEVLLAIEPRLRPVLLLTSREALEDYDPGENYMEEQEAEEEWEEPEVGGEVNVDEVFDDLFGASNPDFLMQVAANVLRASQGQSEMRQDLLEENRFRLFGRVSTSERGSGVHYIEFGPWLVKSYGRSHISLHYQREPLFDLTAQDLPESPGEGDFFERVEGFLHGFFQGALREFSPHEEAPETPGPRGALTRAAEDDLF